MKPKVAITKGNAYTATKKVLELTDFKKMLKGKSKIVIKPNLVVAKKASEGITTDVNIVRAILDQIPSNKKISIVEGCSAATTSFELNGYLDLKKQYDIDIIDANLSEYKKVKVRKPLVLKSIKISKHVLNSDFLISVGKLKIHSIALITGSLKNMMGACPKEEKFKIHSFIPRSLIDLISLILPDFGVIDGIVANEMDENVSHPIKMGIILASKDCVALDSVASRVMGVEPEDVYYIKRSAEIGFGKINTNDIEIVGEKLEKIRRNFRRTFVLRSESQRLIIKLLFQMGLYEFTIPYIRKVKNLLAI